MHFGKLLIFFYTEAMSATKRAVVLTMTVAFAYIFLQIPALSHYSLQLFAILCLLYWWLQRRQHQQLFYIFNEAASINIFFLNTAFLILIAGSGALTSPFFVLTFVQLFFVALACENQLAILLSLELVLFYLGLSLNQYGLALPGALSMTEISNLIAIPLVMVFYLFGKVQYQRAHYRSLLLDSERQERLRAQADDLAVAFFVRNLLDRRLPMLEYLLTFPEKNSVALVAEIQVLKQDLNTLIKEIDQSKMAPEEENLAAETEAELLIKAIDEAV